MTDPTARLAHHAPPPPPPPGQKEGQAPPTFAFGVRGNFHSGGGHHAVHGKGAYLSPLSVHSPYGLTPQSEPLLLSHGPWATAQALTNSFMLCSTSDFRPFVHPRPRAPWFRQGGGEAGPVLPSLDAPYDANTTGFQDSTESSESCSGQARLELPCT